MSDTINVLAILATIAIGSGTGGIIGAIVTLRRFRIEQEESRTNQQVSIQSVDVEQFKALFPGGLGDAVEHWRDEAKKLYEEVDKLRTTEKDNHDQILTLRTELAETKRDLAKANRRIAHLESESGVDDG